MLLYNIRSIGFYAEVCFQVTLFFLTNIVIYFIHFTISRFLHWAISIFYFSRQSNNWVHCSLIPNPLAIFMSTPDCFISCCPPLFLSMSSVLPTFGSHYARRGCRSLRCWLQFSFSTKTRFSLALCPIRKTKKIMFSGFFVGGHCGNFT